MEVGCERALRSYEATQMEVVNPDLPEELEEKIIALLPFPAIFKARCLSRSWRTKLSSIKTIDDEATKLVKTMFQRQVRDWSNNWGTCCPVLLCDGKLFAYDQICRLWRRRRLPKIFRVERGDGRAIEGPLLYGSSQFRIKNDKTGSIRFEKRLCVANIFTKTYQKLPRCPIGGTVLSEKLVVTSMSMETYKVILLCHNNGEFATQYSVAIYTFTFNSWITKKFVVPAGFDRESVTIDPFYSAGYLNGIFYMYSNSDKYRLLAFNVEERTLKTLTNSNAAEMDYLPLISHQIPCNGNLFIVDIPNTGPRELRLSKLDLGSLQLSEVSWSPAVRQLRVGTLHFASWWCVNIAVSNGDCIFLGDSWCCGLLVSYNMVTDEWNCFPFPGAGNEKLRQSTRTIKGRIYIK